MKVEKSRITNYAHCDDCEMEFDGENASTWARKHVKETTHSVTITSTTWFYPEKEEC